MIPSLMATTGHTAFQMLWRTERFVDMDAAIASVRRRCEQRIADLFDRLETEMGDARFLIGDGPTAADMYLFFPGRWGLRLARPLSCHPRLLRFTERTADLPAVRRAMAREGIALHGPKSGLD